MGNISAVKEQKMLVVSVHSVTLSTKHPRVYYIRCRHGSTKCTTPKCTEVTLISTKTAYLPQVGRKINLN